LTSADAIDAAPGLRYSVLGHKLMMLAAKKAGGGGDNKAGGKKKDGKKKEGKGKKKGKKGKDDTLLVEQNRAKYEPEYSISYSTSTHFFTHQFKIPSGVISTKAPSSIQDV
jgi:hypothetical protein